MKKDQKIMPLFSYKGRGRNKEFIEGISENSTMEEAITSLRNQGITIIDVALQTEKKGLSALLNMKLTKASVKIQELIIFCRQMHTLTKAGISLVVSIRRLAEIAHNEGFREALHNIERGILAGQSLGACLKRCPNIFSPLFVELIGLGEESGKLDEAFMQVGNYLSLEFETRKRFKAAVRYPIIVITAILAAIIIVNIFVIPNFARLYSSFQTQLPLPTILMIKFSNFLRDNWMFMLGGIILFSLIIRNYLKTDSGKLFWHRYQFRLPIIGSLLERIVLSRFARTMAIVFAAGVPLERGINLVAGAVGNVYAKGRILTMRERIEGGENLSRAAVATHLFSPLILQMISVGEETGAMETMLQEIALFYEREIDYELESLGDKIEPVLLLIVAGMVLMLAIAVFLPMWDIYQFAQQGSH
jgi:MSHA biogenesis protein MshG